MKQHKSEAQRKKAFASLKWEQMVFVLVKQNQGWTVREIAKKLDLSTQRVHAIMNYLGEMTPDELTNEYYNYLLTIQKD